MAVEVASGSVVVLGGAWVGVAGEDLGVAQRDTGVEACAPQLTEGRVTRKGARHASSTALRRTSRGDVRVCHFDWIQPCLISGGRQPNHEVGCAGVADALPPQLGWSRVWL